jgi:hypothetical protein
MTSGLRATYPAIYRALREAASPEASGYVRDPESPALTAPPSLPAVRAGTLVSAIPGRGEEPGDLYRIVGLSCPLCHFGRYQRFLCARRGGVAAYETIRSYDGALGDVLHSFFGYSDAPTPLQLLIYVAYLAIVVVVYLGVRARLAARGNGPHPATH